jgi:hypothetical protein
MFVGSRLPRAPLRASPLPKEPRCRIHGQSWQPRCTSPLRARTVKMHVISKFSSGGHGLHRARCTSPQLGRQPRCSRCAANAATAASSGLLHIGLKSSAAIRSQQLRSAMETLGVRWQSPKPEVGGSSPPCPAPARKGKPLLSGTGRSVDARPLVLGTSWAHEAITAGAI